MQDQPLSKAYRIRFRISLQALMIVVLIFGAGLGWIVHRARVQLAAVAAIQSAGGRVRYDREWAIGSVPDGTL
jgi:hypothetical protein